MTMHFFESILDHYSWYGVALIVVILLLFIAQFYYYVIRYDRISRFRLMRRKVSREENPPISVIVVVRGENEQFLTEELRALMSQEYNHYEVVVVYVGGDMDYYAELQLVKELYSNMRLTKLGGNDRLYITTKQALNIGIKSAQYNNLLFTTTGACPVSNMWVSLMAKGFERGSVVVGSMLPRFDEGGRGIKNYLMRMTEFHRQRNAASATIKGALYYAPRCNFGFTRELYETTRGFNNLNLDSGENDLYLQLLMTCGGRVAPVMTSRSAVAEYRDSSWREWLEGMRYDSITTRYYRHSMLGAQRHEQMTRILLLLCAIVAMVVMPLEVKIGVAVLLLLRYIFVVWSTRRTAHKLGESGVVKYYWIFDIVGPIIEYVISLRHHDGKAKVWR
jgi:hypothetical protein